MKTVDAAQMRALDARTISEAGISGKTLMDRAGRGAADAIIEFVGRFSSPPRRFVLVAGKGNNGGDAFVAARYLSEKTGSDTEIVLYSLFPISSISGDAAYHASILPEKVRCEICSTLSSNDFREGDILVDGLLGTGLSGLVREPFKSVIEVINASACPVVSLDIPSGLDGDTGKSLGIVVKADMTVTFGLPKMGLFLRDGAALSGLLRFVDIGIPREFIRGVKSGFESFFRDDMKGLLPKYRANSHKYTRGLVYVIGGNLKYRGAPLLAAKAALKGGCGLVNLMVPESIMEDMDEMDPSIIISGLESEDGSFSPSSLSPSFFAMMKKKAVVAAGPGMGTDKLAYPMINYLWNSASNAVFDADALNIISQMKQCRRRCPAILTPHEGEMRRLECAFETNKSGEKDRIGRALELAVATGCVVLFKGNRTVVASPQGDVSVNSSGSSILSTAGSGDVLTGLISAFYAQGLEPYQAARAGAFIHGSAGEIYQYGDRGMTASDLLELLPRALP